MGLSFMQDDRRNDISVYRLAKAKECVVTANNNIVAGDFKAAANRSYYCIFNAMRAILALNSFDSKKHSGIISAVVY